jgi:UDPglucose 6-dehydrogenase
LKASVGFGGSCFQKDILNLVYLCEHYGLREPAEYWRHVITINDWQKARFVKQMVDTMFNTVSGKRIAVLGFAFKKDTNDTRASAAIDVCRGLLAENADLAIVDPKVPADTIFADLQRATGQTADELRSRVVCEPDVYNATAGAHAIAVMTEWGQFRSLDFQRIYDQMQKPAFVFDGRDVLPHAALSAIGFEVRAIGKLSRTNR